MASSCRASPCLVGCRARLTATRHRGGVRTSTCLARGPAPPQAADSRQKAGLGAGPSTPEWRSREEDGEEGAARRLTLATGAALLTCFGPALAWADDAGLGGAGPSADDLAPIANTMVSRSSLPVGAAPPGSENPPQ